MKREFSSRSGAIVVGFVILGGCDADARTSGAPNDAPGQWARGQEWRVEREFTIGATDGEDAFGNVVDVELDPLGRVWIADAGSHQIRIYDRTGAPVRSFGRKGGGPGDFGAIAGLTLAPNGQMWVMDSGNARYAVYDTAGHLSATHSRVSAMASSPWPGIFDRSGRLYDVSGSISPDASINTMILRGDALERPDTFRVPQFTAERFSISRGDANNRSVQEINVPFSGSQMWAVDPAGAIWIANTANYRVERHSFEGRVGTVVQRQAELVPVSRAEREMMLENYEGYRRAGGVIDESRIPSHHPALRSFLLDDAGHLWVIPTTRTRSGQVADVFTLNGAFLGRVSLPIPPRSGPKAIRGGRMVVIARDSLDMQTITVFRIVGP